MGMVVTLFSMGILVADETKWPVVERVQISQGKVIAFKDGSSFAPTNTVAMPLQIKVMTNLTFTVEAGAPRKLTEGQILSANGMLQSPDGTLVPVIDHVIMLAGVPTLYQNGKATPITAPAELGQGTRILPDGTIESPGGRRRLLDGQMFKLNGTAIPATDTVSLIAGKVVLQKDGSRITLKSGQTFMMDDGTKVFSDGKMVYRDGTTKTLAEGETVEVTGVRRR